MAGQWDETTAALRMQEQSRRNSRARARALGDLAKLFPDELKELYEKRKAEVYAESDPLPGDES